MLIYHLKRVAMSLVIQSETHMLFCHRKRDTMLICHHTKRDPFLL